MHYLSILVTLLPLLALGQTTQMPSIDYANSHYGGSGGLPSGMITLILSGTCPSGFTEATALDGVMLKGTLAAHGDVGTTGGSATITPTGTVSQPTLSMNSYTPAGTNGTVSFTPSGTIAWPVGVPTFSGTSGTVSAATISWPASVPTQAADTFGTTKFTTSGSGTAAFTSETARGAISWPAGVPTNGTTTFTPAGTIAWPAGVPLFSGQAGTVPAQAFTGTPSTLTGTVSQPTFTGTPVDPSPSYVKVIFCQKT